MLPKADIMKVLTKRKKSSLFGPKEQQFLVLIKLKLPNLQDLILSRKEKAVRLLREFEFVIIGKKNRQQLAKAPSNLKSLKKETVMMILKIVALRRNHHQTKNIKDHHHHRE